MPVNDHYHIAARDPRQRLPGQVSAQQIKLAGVGAHRRRPPAGRGHLKQELLDHPSKVQIIRHWAPPVDRENSGSAIYDGAPSTFRAFGGRICGVSAVRPSAAFVSRFLASAPARLRRDGREKAPTTLNRTRAVIRAFFAWCERTGRVDRNPAFLVKASPCRPPVRYLTRREIRHFLAGIRRSTHRLARRDHALFSTIAYTGLRLSEAARALWGDLDLRRHRLLVGSTKGGGPEIRHIPRRLFRILVALRRDVGDQISLEESPLFRSSGGEALSPRGVQYRFAFWLSRSGLRRRISVHSLRHTFATLLYHATRDLLLVSRALGHRDIRTTQR